MMNEANSQAVNHQYADLRQITLGRKWKFRDIAAMRKNLIIDLQSSRFSRVGRMRVRLSQEILVPASSRKAGMRAKILRADLDLTSPEVEGLIDRPIVR
jgi:hypothetical protein